VRKKRENVEGVFFHVTSRTNNKVRVFENKLGRKIMLMTLQEAKDKFRFRLGNFCIMPTHIHLLIKPLEGTSLSNIMHWIKLQSAKRWNFTHGSINHVWGDRYFARVVKDHYEYETLMEYIDQNPVKAGLVATPSEWKASGAFYKAHDLEDLVDFEPFEHKDKREKIKLLPPIPFLVSNLLPFSQHERTMKYYGVYAETLKRFYETVIKMPNISYADYKKEAIASLLYYTDTADYFIYEYDRQDTMYGKVCLNVYPATTEYKAFSLTSLKNTQSIKLDLSWVVGTRYPFSTLEKR